LIDFAIAARLSLAFAKYLSIPAIFLNFDLDVGIAPQKGGHFLAFES
jgi:hypothetical protein